MITRDESYLQSGLSGKLLQGTLNEHLRRLTELTRLRQLYDGQGDILHRQRAEGLPNARLSHGFGRYIVTVASSYLMGGDVAYTRQDGESCPALEQLLRAYRDCDVQSADMELAKHASLYGRGVEVVYADEKTRPRTAVLDPRSAFVVYGEDVSHRPLFGVSVRPVQSEGGAMQGWEGTVYTDHETLTFRAREAARLLTGAPVNRQPHYFGGVPMVEYWNNEDEQSDLECVESLVEAYDLLQSDRVNDWEQRVDALLLLYGAQLSVDERGRSPAQQLRQDKLLYLPDRDAGAEYLTPGQTGGDGEVLRLALERDIHKFSMVPDLSDEHFGGNLSGVAIKYKLMGLEQLTRLKERWFREGLRERMRLFSHFLAVKGGRELDTDQVRMYFRRTLPVDNLETAQMVRTLSGMVPDKVLVSQLPFMEGT